MHGYETKEQRDAYTAALVREKENHLQAIEEIKERLSVLDKDTFMNHRSVLERDLEARKKTVTAVERELRQVRGVAPQKRAQRR